MEGDRRQILRQVQQQRQATRQPKPPPPSNDPRASMLRPYNPMDFHDTDPDYDDAPHPSQDYNRTDVLKLVLYDLNSAIAPRSLRLTAIQAAMDEFDHDEEALHNEELDLRADHILLQKLTYAMSIDPSDEEVGYICAAMEMVYRAGKMRLAKSFHEISDAVLPMFVEMIKRPPYVEIVEEAAEETKEDRVAPPFETGEAEEREFRGIEPVEDFDPYAPHLRAGESDEESAESVTIPAGTGEYFDHMKKMAEMGEHAEKDLGGGGVDPGNALVPQPVNLGAAGAGAGAMEPYNPQQQQGGQQPSNVQQQQQGGQQQYTPQQLYELAQQIARMENAKPGAGAMEPYNPQQQQGGQQPSNVQQQQQGGQQQYTPQQLYELAQQIARMEAAKRQQMVGVPPGAQPQYPAGAPQPAAYNVTPNQMVPMQPGAQMGEQFVGQPGQNAPYTGHMVPMQPGTNMGDRPTGQPGQYPENMNNGQYAGGQPAGYQQQPYPGMQMPTYARHAPPYHSAQLVSQQTQFSPSQSNQPAAPADSTALVPTLPLPEEVAAAAQQLSTMTVRDATMTDEEALRLRGGGDDSDDGQDDYNNQGDYNDQSNYDGQDDYNDQGNYGGMTDASNRTGLTDHFDQLYEEQNNFPSAASYDEYVDADQSGRDENPFLDVSEVTGISELGASMKRNDFKNRMNEEQDEAYNGQVPVNEGDYQDNELEGEFGDEDYAQAAEKRFNGQVEADYDVRASNNFVRDESEYAGNETRNYDEATYDAQGNFASDYSEYLNDQAGPGIRQPEYDAQGNLASDYSEYLNDQAGPGIRQPEYDAQGNFASDYSEYLNDQAGPGIRQPEYDAQGNFASDYSEYLNDQAGPGSSKPNYDAQGNFASDYSEYLSSEAGKFPQATDDGYAGNEGTENSSNPFSYNDFDDEAPSNPFIDSSVRSEEFLTSQRGHRGQGGANAHEHEDGGIPVVQEYDNEDDFDESSMPVHIGEIPVDSLPNGGDGAIPSHIGQTPLSASMRSTGDLTFDTTLRNMDGQDNGFNAAAQNLYQRNDTGGDGQPSYTEGYDGNGFAHGMQDQHQKEDWTRGAESERTGGEYPIPTFRPEGGEGDDYPRRDSDLTGFTDDQWNSERSGAQGMYDNRQGSNLHMVQEEPTAHTQDQHPESMAYADVQHLESTQYANNQQQNYTYDQVQQNANNDDIFQFRAPTMAKPMASGDYLSTHRVSEGLVCPLAVRSVLKILRYFSRVLSAMEQLAQQPGLVDALLYQMTRNPLGNEDEEEISARVDAIAVLVNLACAEENKIMLVYHPGLLDAVINIANHDPIEEAREHAAIVMMNLAYAEENKVHMVNQDNLLDTLVHLLSDASPFTRRYASAALFTLACTYANTAVMARHCDGGILEALRKVLLNDPVDEARVNAAEALFNMARNNSDDTVENMGNHPKLLASLAHSVLTDYSPDVRAYSARALEWLSADIHFPMQCHPRLLQALTTASQWTKTTCIAEALKMQASLSENRKSMVEHPGLLDALAQLSLLDGINDDEVKTCAIAALERLSKEPSTRHLMVRNEGVMTALTRATFDDNGYDDNEEEAPSAVLMKTALKNLAEHM